MKYNWEMAKHNVSIAKAEYSPTISAGAGYNQGYNSNTRYMRSSSRTLPSVDARLRELIWNFGKTSSYI